jgi:plastocyanin
MSREHNRRVLYGLGIPIAAALFIAAMLWAMSRVLLAIDPAVAPWVALGFAANILVASALAATLRGRRAFVMITAVIVATIVAGGIAGAAVGEWPVHNLAEGEHQSATPPPGGPTPATTGEPTEPPPTGTPAPGGEAHIVAEGTAFDTDRLSLPAEKEATLVFENRDPVPHNVAIYTDQDGEALFQGELVTATTAEYTVPPLEPGSYFFQCDVHPDVMTGTVEAG